MLAANKQEIIDAYFLVIHYYERTLLLLRSAFKKRKERLACAALSNLLILQSVLMRMHQNQPKHIPLAMPLTEVLFDSYLRGLIVRVLGLYKGRPDAAATSEIRLSGWEQGGRLTIPELPLISILQTLTAMADIDLVTPEKRTEYEDLLVRANGIREALKAYWPQTEQADFFLCS